MSRTTRLLILISTAGVLCGLVALSDASPHRSCGEERAKVKLGTDPEAQAGKVDPSPRDTFVAELVKLQRPSTTTRRAPAELVTWRIHATIVDYKLESDGDYHVVIADADGHHMIMEFSDPLCSADGAWAKDIAAARAAFDAAVGAHKPAAKLRHVSIEATINGVGFFDFLHGQTGVAPNGIELHPVLAIEIGGGS